MMQAWQNIIVRSALAATLCLGEGSRHAVADPPAAVPSSAGPIVISLRSRVQVEARVVLLTDIAQVTGGDAELRERVQSLDLEDALQPGESLAITPTQVEFRLRLAGIDVDDVSIRGNSVRVTAYRTNSMRAANSTRGTAPLPSAIKTTANSKSAVSREASSLEGDIVKAAKDCVLAKLPWKGDAVDIRLAQPLVRDIGPIANAAEYECRAELRSAGPAVGRVQVRVVAEAPNQPSFDVQVLLDVRHFEDVVLTTRTLARGQTISAAEVYVDRQDVTEMADYCSNVDQLIGATTKRSVRALLPLRKGDVEPTGRSVNAVLIKRRDRVKMIAKTGAVEMTMVGEAQQDGRAGETILLRNLNSDVTVQGRVTGANEVEISF
jgi:flagellar basal body P-ring formation protein FlgA